MSATAIERPLPASRRARPKITAHRVFAVAAGAALLHALDDALLHRQAGLRLGQHVVAGLISVVLAVGAIWAFPRMRTSLQAATAFSFGALAAVNGAMHIQHVKADGVARSDLTGLLAFAAGLVLAGLAVVLLWRQRRWWQRLLAVPLAILGSLGRSAEPAARGPHPEGAPADPADLGGPRRGIRVQRALRPGGRAERRALEPARRDPHGRDPAGRSAVRAAGHRVLRARPALAARTQRGRHMAGPSLRMVLE